MHPIYQIKRSCDCLGRLIVFVLALCAASSVHAVPEPYSGVLLDSESQSAPADFSRDGKLIGATSSMFDFAASTIEEGAFSETVNERLFLLNDGSVSGVSVTSFSDSASSDCDDGVPPCPEPILLSQNLLIANADETFPAKGVLSPGNELLVTAAAELERSFPQTVSIIDMGIHLKKPASLTLADLNGTYAIKTLERTFDSFANGFTDEFLSTSDVSISFAGNGSCSGSVNGTDETFQVTNWPDLNSRANVRAANESAVAITSCSYTVDPVAGSTTLALVVPDDGDTENISLTLLVSDQKRYLIGQLANEEVDGDETSLSLQLLVGTRSAAAVTNSQLQGVYFLSSFGKSFVEGSDIDFIARAAVDLSGGTADGEGFSACTLLGHTAAGTRRNLTGVVPAASDSHEFTGTVLPAYTQCRYRATTGSTVELGLSVQGTEWDTQIFDTSDDLSTLIGTQVSTSDDPLPADMEVLLNAPASATARIGVLQRFNGSAGDEEVASFVEPIIPAIDPGVLLVSSVLPASRSVQVGATATAFATMINAGTTDGEFCTVQPAGPLNAGFFYQTTNPVTNAPVGERNQPIIIAAGATQTFVFGFTPNTALSPAEVPLEYTCLNGSDASSFVGLNTLLLSAETNPVPDVIALSATVSNDGVVRLPGNSGFLTLASVNVGASSPMISVSADTGGVSLPVTLSICETDPATSVCTNPVSPTTGAVTTVIDANATPTFAVFVSASEPIALDPAGKRIFVRFTDSGGTVRGATSVAVQTE